MLTLYPVTLFLSAALMFLVQPMFGKMALPLLGGSPAVWNTQVVFCQGVLLFGYLYAHLTSRWLGIRRQALIQCFLMLLNLPPPSPSTYRYPSRPDSPRGGKSHFLASVSLTPNPGSSFLCGRHHQPDASKVVFGHPSSKGRRPLFPLCSQQRRKSGGSSRLSTTP